MSKKLLLLGLTLLMSACVATVGNQFHTDFPIGKVIRDKVTLPQGDVLLPEGDWTVLATETGQNNSYITFGAVALGRIDSDNFLRGLVTIASPLDAGMGYSFYSASFCDPQPNLLYHHTNANVDLGRQSCFGVKKKTISAFDNFAEYVKTAMSNAHAMGVDRPYDMLSTAYRFTRGHKFLYVEYGFDYRQDADQMLPDYADGDPVELTRAFFPKDKEENVKAVVRWARENAAKIETEFLD
ncbi:MAG: hypothetical protein RIG26_17140 [Thalassospira sp.]|uniref:hypothetical protein n=1 Tax=Thalassospira sp. TaxID=1912094 RepID=UPI0032EE74A2